MRVRTLSTTIRSTRDDNQGTAQSGVTSGVVQTAVVLVECLVFKTFSFGTGGDGRATRWLLEMQYVSVLQRSKRIAHHRWRMDAAHSRFYSGDAHITSDGLVGYDVTEALPTYEYHRDQLVSLGYFFHVQYKFDQVPNVDGVHGAIWRQAKAAFPDNAHITFSHPGYELQVWDRPDRRAAWDSFHAEINVADFAERNLE